MALSAVRPHHPSGPNGSIARRRGIVSTSPTAVIAPIAASANGKWRND
jgi:hypothetical protein